VHREIECELSEATSPSSRAPTRSYRLCPATPPVSERYHRGACREQTAQGSWAHKWSLKCHHDVIMVLTSRAVSSTPLTLLK
jgi:hypothetical protein